MTSGKNIVIDLNADLGEHPGAHLDAEIMPYLSSCNIACGGHIGDEYSIRNAMLLAQKNKVAIGAHPSFPDKTNFGRLAIEMKPESLASTIAVQIDLARSVAQKLGIKLNHIKPHGALYNLAAKEEVTSRLIGEVIQSIDPSLKWMGLAHSVSERVANDLGIVFIAEAFADRRYEADKTLRSRASPGAIIEDEKEVLLQVEELALRSRVFSADWISIASQSICLHSDTPGAVNLAKKIYQHLVSKGVDIYSI